MCLMRRSLTDMLRLGSLCFDSFVTGCAISICIWPSASSSLSFRSV